MTAAYIPDDPALYGEMLAACRSLLLDAAAEEEEAAALELDAAALLLEAAAEEAIAEATAAIEEMMARHNLSAGNVQALGISCGGPLNSKTGRVLSPPNLFGWDDIPIVEMMEARYGIPTALQNDANACALAEWRFGAARGFENVIFCTFGTGMGAGLILNGRLYEGTTGMAGEIGHLRLSEHGPVGFGKEGSFEGFCSGGGIAQFAKSQLKMLSKNILPKLVKKLLLEDL